MSRARGGRLHRGQVWRRGQGRVVLCGAHWGRSQGAEAQWVSKYHLEFKACGGDEWLKLGSLAGNSDGTSAITHRMSDVLGSISPPTGPVKARYVRFCPEEWFGGCIALRVEVFVHERGHPLMAGLPDSALTASTHHGPLHAPHLARLYSTQSLGISGRRRELERGLGHIGSDHGQRATSSGRQRAESRATP